MDSILHSNTLLLIAAFGVCLLQTANAAPYNYCCDPSILQNLLAALVGHNYI